MIGYTPGSGRSSRSSNAPSPIGTVSVMRRSPVAGSTVIDVAELELDEVDEGRQVGR